MTHAHAPHSAAIPRGYWYCGYRNTIIEYNEYVPRYDYNVRIFIDNGDSKISLKVRPTNVAVFAIVTHRLVAIYFNTHTV